MVWIPREKLVWFWSLVRSRVLMASLVRRHHTLSWLSRYIMILELGDAPLIFFVCDWGSFIWYIASRNKALDAALTVGMPCELPTWTNICQTFLIGFLGEWDVLRSSFHCLQPPLFLFRLLGWLGANVRPSTSTCQAFQWQFVLDLTSFTKLEYCIVGSLQSVWTRLYTYGCGGDYSLE